MILERETENYNKRTIDTSTLCRYLDDKFSVSIKLKNLCSLTVLDDTIIDIIYCLNTMSAIIEDYQKQIERHNIFKEELRSFFYKEDVE